jgi:RNA polymerase sigma factor (sigma-70 family)
VSPGSRPLPAGPAAAPHGSDERVAGLVRRPQRAGGAYLDTLGCPGALVEDLVQETFVAALRGGWPGEGEEPARAWLRSVARNRFRDHLRRVRGTQVVDVEAVDAAWRRFDRGDDGAEYLDALRACLATLGDRARRALELQYADGLDRAGVGAKLGLSLGGVKALLARGKALLRTCIERRLA